MRYWILSASTALALVLPASATFALTPEEVWENWKTIAEGTGGTLTTTSETRNGEKLEITGITTTSRDENLGTVTTSRVESLTLAEQGDGTVRVTMSDTYSAEFAETADGGTGAGDIPVLSFEIYQPGSVIIASGEPGSVSYAFTTPEMKVTISGSETTAGTSQDAQMVVDVSDIAGTYQLDPRAEGGFDLLGDLSTGEIVLTTTGAERDGGASWSGTVTITGVSTRTSGSFIEPDKMAELSQALAAGFALDSQTQIGAMDLTADIVQHGETVKASAKFDNLSFGAIFNASLIDYGVSLHGFEAGFEGLTDGPGAGSAALDEASVRVRFPVGVHEEAGDFGFLLRLTEVTLSESIWGLADPTGLFTRDPATLIVDLDAKAAWLVDVFDQSGGDPFAGEEMPFRLDSLAVKEAVLKLVGAAADAQGALTFDNSDLETFEGFPVPTGELTINLAGISSLLDQAVTFGVIGADEVTGLRMGLAMLARPGPGPDQLIIGIEFRDKGIFVNGQQVM